jgi:hypothetical protein
MPPALSVWPSVGNLVVDLSVMAAFPASWLSLGSLGIQPFSAIYLNMTVLKRMSAISQPEMSERSIYTELRWSWLFPVSTVYQHFIVWLRPVVFRIYPVFHICFTFGMPNKSPEPTAVGAVCSAVAVHVAGRRWLSFFR